MWDKIKNALCSVCSVYDRVQSFKMDLAACVLLLLILAHDPANSTMGYVYLVGVPGTHDLVNVATTCREC